MTPEERLHVGLMRFNAMYERVSSKICTVKEMQPVYNYGKNLVQMFQRDNELLLEDTNGKLGALLLSIKISKAKEI